MRDGLIVSIVGMGFTFLFLALVVVLVTGSGRFAGLDRIVHGLFGRPSR